MALQASHFCLSVSVCVSVWVGGWVYSVHDMIQRVCLCVCVPPVVSALRSSAVWMLDHVLGLMLSHAAKETYSRCKEAY